MVLTGRAALSAEREGPTHRAVRRLAVGALWVTTLLSASAAWGQGPSAPSAARTSVTASAQGPERGWLGISVNVTIARDGVGPGELVVEILRTVEDGPAWQAGLAPGDVIHRIGEEPLTLPGWQRLTQSLASGDEVRLGVRRADGALRQVRLTAGRRPEVTPASGTSDRLAAAREAFEARLRSSGGAWASRDHVRVLIRDDSVHRTSVRIIDSGRRIGAPFGSGPPSDRLPLEGPLLWPQQTPLRRDFDASLGREGFGPAGSPLVSEELARISALLAEMGAAARPQVRSMRAESDAPGQVVRVRPISAGLVGRNFVGGAQLTDLNPPLSEYFGVDRGVLVIDVLLGTPAFRAGLRPGDVITAVDETDVESLVAFRGALQAVRERGATLGLIRKGAPLRLTLSR